MEKVSKIKLETFCRREWWRGFITAQDKYCIIRNISDMKELKREYAKYIKSNPKVKKEINELKDY